MNKIRKKVLGLVIVAFIGFLLGGALFAKFIHLLEAEASIYVFVPYQIFCVGIALYYRVEIAEKLKKKEK